MLTFHERLDYISIRPMIQYIKKNIDGALVGVEVGVAKGNNALSIMKNLDIKELYLVDPYTNRFGKQLQCIAFCRLEKYYKCLHWIDKTSYDAHDLIPSNIDFVYLDGCHEQDYVETEIALYYEKVRDGGILGGHDYSMRHNNNGDVVRAVNDFCSFHNIVLNHKEMDWWIKKI